MADSTLLELEMKDIVRSLERADAELSKELVKEMRELGKWSAGKLRDNAPVGSGRLRKSIKPSVTKTRAIVKGKKHTWFANYGRHTYNPWKGSLFIQKTREQVDPEVDRRGREIMDRVAKKFAE
jgi:hypothetical protein